MKILILNHSDHNGGAARASHRLYESLAYLFGQILSMYSYYRIKLGDFVWKLFLKTLSMIGIYGIARSFYRALWRKK